MILVPVVVLGLVGMIWCWGVLVLWFELFIDSGCLCSRVWVFDFLDFV